jgi:hypothetical protein
MKAKHTPTPWHHTQHGSTGKPNILWSPSGTYIGQVGVLEIDGPADANADRIIACVNACEGIDDPAKSLNDARRLLQSALQKGSNEEARDSVVSALRLPGVDA